MRGLTSDERWHLAVAAEAQLVETRRADRRVLDQQLVPRGLVVLEDVLTDEGITAEYKATKMGRLLLAITASTGCDP
jgi:hypothetical protein